MERITERDSHGWFVTMPLDEVFQIRGPVIDRLAAYEDTGLEPNECKRFLQVANEKIDRISADLQEAIKVVKGLFVELDAFRSLGHIDHLRTLVRAEREGRLLVLPEYAICEVCPLCCGNCGSCHVTGYPPDHYKCRSVIREKAEVALEGDGE